MGLALSLGLEIDSFDGLDQWLSEAFESETHADTSYIRGLLVDVGGLMNNPSNPEHNVKLLVGVTGGLTARNLIGILQILGCAWEGEWVFATADPNSRAYYELVLVVFRWIKDNGLGDATGRANLFLWALAHTAIEAAENTSRNVLDEGKKPKTNVFKRFANASTGYSRNVFRGGAHKKGMNDPRAKLIATNLRNEDAVALIIKSYNEAVRSHAVAVRRGAELTLKNIIKQLRNFRDQVEEEAKQYYRIRGNMLGLECRVGADGMQLNCDLISRISIALVDILIRDAGESDAEAVKMRRMDFLPLETKIEDNCTIARLTSDYQADVFNFMMSMIHECEGKGNISGVIHKTTVLQGKDGIAKKFHILEQLLKNLFNQEEAKQMMVLWQSDKATTRFAVLEIVMHLTPDI